MNARTLEAARLAAVRFLSLVADLEARAGAESGKPQGQRIYWDITGCRESAAVRRASMDLSRALSDLRR